MRDEAAMTAGRFVPVWHDGFPARVRPSFHASERI